MEQKAGSLRYFGSAQCLTGPALKNYLETLNPEEVRSVLDMWRTRASRKDLIHFSGNQNAKRLPVRA